MATSSFTTETKLTRKGALILNKLLESNDNSKQNIIVQKVDKKKVLAKIKELSQK